MNQETSIMKEKGFPLRLYPPIWFLLFAAAALVLDRLVPLSFGLVAEPLRAAIGATFRLRHQPLPCPAGGEAAHAALWRDLSAISRMHTALDLIFLTAERPISCCSLRESSLPSNISIAFCSFPGEPATGYLHHTQGGQNQRTPLHSGVLSDDNRYQIRRSVKS